MTRPRAGTEQQLELREATRVLVSPEAHANDERLNAACALLRRNSPVHWVDDSEVRPFWAITRYRDVISVERQPARFSAAPRTLLSGTAAEAALSQMAGKPQLIRGLIQMDEPDHAAYRAIAQPHFTPDGLIGLEKSLSGLAATIVGEILERGTECDFADEVAARFSAGVLARMLGIPQADIPLLQKLARGVVAPNDPDRCLSELPTETIRTAMLGLRDYFFDLAAERRARPRNDLATAIACALVGGVPIPFYELISYYVLLTTAGFDSSTFAMAGGLHAMIDGRDEFSRLKREPMLLDSAIDEMLRWTSPARSIVRTALQDTRVNCVTIREGEAVGLFFNSANRDEAVFPKPDSFIIDRNPNPHIAFGRGIHHCLGYHLVRMEMRILFSELLRRMDRVKLIGAPQRTRSAVITGISSLPISFRPH